MDCILANPAARSLVTDFTLLRDLAKHLGLQITLDLQHMEQQALWFPGPTAYQPTPEGIPDEELHALGELVGLASQTHVLFACCVH